MAPGIAALYAVPMSWMNAVGECVSRPLFGCVTTGEAWQFLRLEGAVAAIDRSRLFLDNLGGILAVLRAILVQSGTGT